jgi:hypothetical protein
MAKKKTAKTETKSEFLRKALSKNPNLDHRQVNQRWTKAGHTGDIINASFYQVRAKPGIKTEWVWVKESESEVESTPTEVTATVYQIEITILGTQPPVWRRIQIPDRTSAIFTRLSRPSWAGNTATCISLSSTTNTTVNRI